jgi:hypothetical protein
MSSMTIQTDKLDEVVTAYTAWQRYSQSVHSAYDAWAAAEADESALRYAAYLEELDREQRACELYAATVARASASAAA